MTFVARLRRFAQLFAVRLEFRQPPADLFDRQPEPRLTVFTCGRCRLEFSAYGKLKAHLRDCGRKAS